MPKEVDVRNVKIGSGVPKIAVSIMGKDDLELCKEIKNLSSIKFDIVEWRVDFYEDVHNIESVKKVLSNIRRLLANTPIIFTFRSKSEGGNKEISKEYYIELVSEIVKTKEADLVDVELFMGDESVKNIIDLSHKNEVKVIVSNHDFSKTPSKEEIIQRLRKMICLGADLPKIAVMPKNMNDVLKLLSATNEINQEYRDKPIITMSMGKMGIISRVAGEFFGSALTFGAVNEVSAPGQIQADDLGIILNLLHKSKN
ncbi:MAG: type I 3-dehydroquinate dehydratase [Clostridium sp.]|nr:type I 3-dehydroquinate dehydratase [Clostridium sp.]